MTGSTSPPPFSTHTSRRNGVARVVLHGELDLDTVPLLQDELAFIGNGDGHASSEVLLDLRGLTFIDSTGLRAVLDAAMTASRSGGRLAAVGVTSPVRKLFEITGTVEHLNESGALVLIQRFTGPDGKEAAR